MHFLERVFQMESGYVLNFTDRTFAGFVADAVDIDVDEFRFHQRGRSKANRLRTFLQIEKRETVAEALQALWAYRAELLGEGILTDPDQSKTESRFTEIVNGLNGIATSALKASTRLLSITE